MNFKKVFVYLDIIMLLMFVIGTIYSYFTAIQAPDSLLLQGISYCILRILLKEDIEE